ncbi:NADH-quinone oxidoreductase subunit L [Mucilaginibacter pallidiroseus]|uniref:NADH-quinone oxidoreductase subunit L n=1 Tax=Mucilaginibacter pallidiroseus TaxID=2599295 RepID=A0A563U3I9_9SPHI|nr:NADH-quinone oxidoreductase subunit L [Mucilaginibacter pallidiroseus]
MVTLVLTAVTLPFVAFLINFLLLQKSKVSGWVSTAAILCSAILAVKILIALWNQKPITAQFAWFQIGITRYYAGIWLNNLSVLMLALVPLIALPVHIYSTAYMKHDSGYGRYFTYLSLFCFSMMALVVMRSMLLMYAFWELVGFSSYLLIGFWYTRESAAAANKKAFIMNRIGDIGLLVAIMIIYAMFHTFNMDRIFGEAGLIRKSSINGLVWTTLFEHMSAYWQYVAAAGLFLAVAAKSAQFPLHTWLPDAMEGPTSVSALIHAATMVAAGVFLLGRFLPFFNGTELHILAIVGCLTAFMAATIALTQNDLKRILAYSTISQLGYMVMGIGIEAYPSALMHLVTHAFFKCLLFLVAGIVIHEMKHIKEENNLDIDPQDIRHMGGLRKKLPLTFLVTIIGALALIGLPLTSGYLSKDGILIHSFEWSEDNVNRFAFVPVMAVITTWITAFYVTRMVVKVFFGELQLLKSNPALSLHLTDGGLLYKLPLIFLALCSLFPLFSFNPLSYEHSWLFNGLASNFLVQKNNYHLFVPIIVGLGSVTTMYMAYLSYGKHKWAFPQGGFFNRLSSNEWYIDAFYSRVVVKGVLAFSCALYWFDKNIVDGLVHLLERIGLFLSRVSAWFDKYIVDGLLHTVAAIVEAIGNFARRFQNGKVQYYLYSMLLAVVIVFVLKLLIWS